jgi:hypothetical protein
MKPTDLATSHFDSAARRASEAEGLLGTLKPDGKGGVIQLDKREHGQFLLAAAVREMAAGLKHLTVGLRATYIFLEEINRKLPK